MNRETRQLPAAPRTGIVRRTAAMTAVWLLLGATMGVTFGLRLQGGAIAVFAHVLGGMIACTLPGVLLGLFCAKAKESLVGGICGLLLGIAATLLLGERVPPQTVEHFLVIGGLVGATCWPGVRLVTGVWGRTA
jgi:hypothetical protein